MIISARRWELGIEADPASQQSIRVAVTRKARSFGKPGSPVRCSNQMFPKSFSHLAGAEVS
jgi:hypothetical protein